MVGTFLLMSLAKSILVVQCILGSRRVMLEAERPGRKRELIHYFTSLLFIKARFYTHLLEPSKKMFAWEDRYITHCSGATAILDNHGIGIGKKSGTMGWFVTHKNRSIQFELRCLARKLM